MSNRNVIARKKADSSGIVHFQRTLVVSSRPSRMSDASVSQSIVGPPGVNGGWISQNTFTTCMTTTSPAIIDNVRALRLRGRKRSNQKGTAKPRVARTSATGSQPPSTRRRYQGISSVRLPAQINRYWK